MWRNIMSFIYDKKDDISFAFWMEYDIVPQDPNWLTWFNETWKDEFSIMGHAVTEKWLDENGYDNRKDWGYHINGAACYSSKIFECLSNFDLPIDAAWDVNILKSIEKQAVRPLSLFEFRLGKYGYERDVNKMMVHGAKSIEEKQQILTEVDERDLPVIMNQHKDPFNGDSVLQGSIFSIIKSFDIQTVVETGSFTGSTSQWFSEHVDAVYGFETNPKYLKIAEERAPRVELILGDSAIDLPNLLSSYVRGPVLFYLDAHWGESWPILDELRAIGKSRLAGQSIIVIHDYQTGDLGYDSFMGQPLNEEYLKPVINDHFSNARLFSNKDAVGLRRGTLFIIGEELCSFHT